MDDTITIFRMFGNGTQDIQNCSESTARALATPSEFDGDYYTSRGGLLFAAELCMIEDIPTYIPLADHVATTEYNRAAIEAAQEMFW